MVNFTGAQTFAVELLNNRLPQTLYYHNPAHTLDVLATCQSLAALEGITDPTDLLHLKTAALFHDCGFVHVYDHHEEESCRIAREVLPGFGYDIDPIEIICAIIMKTQLPQQPVTHLERIICDADLDHLGREDFWSVGSRLHKEWNAIGRVHTETEWNNIQISFLKEHQYWTSSAHKLRDAKKKEHLQKLLAITK